MANIIVDLTKAFNFINLKLLESILKYYDGDTHFYSKWIKGEKVKRFIQLGLRTISERFSFVIYIEHKNVYVGTLVWMNAGYKNGCKLFDYMKFYVMSMDVCNDGAG